MDRMSTMVTFNSAHRILLASEFFIARRPVLDRHHRPAAYELVFCNVDSGASAGSGVDGADVEPSTTASVIADVAQHGLLRIVGDVPAYLHLDHEALMTGIFEFLPPARVVLEMMESTPASPEVIERIELLKQRGFLFALDVAGDSDAVQRLLPLTQSVRIDIANRQPSELAGLCSLFRAHQKKLLADNVDSVEDHERCLGLGFDYFRGYYFTKPQIQAGKKLSPSQLAITDLMALVASDAETAEIEHQIKSDVALGLNLLRLVNTPAISPHRIDSLRQALMVLGRNQLQRWLQVMLYADNGNGGQSMQPLLIQATTRGRLLELLAQKLKPGNRGIADTAFTVGIMSLMDTLFSMPMNEILQQIRVVDEVGAALLHRAGYFGELLTLAEYTEWGDHTGEHLLQTIRRQRLSCNDLYALQLAAFEWSDHVSRCID
jgi:EAL and modified HD-GYP domain-containing signal transduction protein